MTANSPSRDDAEIRARPVPREDAQPQSVVERQSSLSAYLLRRSQRRRERFLLRSRTTTMRQELLRALFLTGCILLDLLAIPEAIFLLPGPVGWGVTAAGLVAAIWVEGRFYVDHFALGSRPTDER